MQNEEKNSDSFSPGSSNVSRQTMTLTTVATKATLTYNFLVRQLFLGVSTENTPCSSLTVPVL